MTSSGSSRRTLSVNILLKSKRTHTRLEVQVLCYLHNPPRLVLKRNYRYVRFIFPLACELYSSVNESIECVVLAHTDVAVRIVDCSSLTYNDVSGFNYLTAEFLEAQSFAMGLTTVL